jgi:hypothetical protein
MMELYTISRILQLYTWHILYRGFCRAAIQISCDKLTMIQQMEILHTVTMVIQIDQEVM